MIQTWENNNGGWSWAILPNSVEVQQQNALGEWETLASTTVAREADVSLSFTPSYASMLKLSIKGQDLDVAVGSVRYKRVDIFNASVVSQLCNNDAFDDDYRFGFNGQMKDNEMKGVGNSLDFGARIDDPRLGGRFLSLDPLQQKFPFASPYNFALNSPLKYKDPDGRDIDVAIDDHTITFSSTIYVYGAGAQKVVDNAKNQFEEFSKASLQNRTSKEIEGQVYKVKIQMTYVVATNEDAARIRNNRNGESGDNLFVLDDNIKRANSSDPEPHKNYNSRIYGNVGSTPGDATSGNASKGSSNENSTTYIHEILHDWGLGDRYVEAPVVYTYSWDGKVVEVPLVGVPQEGFSNDIMAGDFLGFSQEHIDNLATKAIELQKTKGNKFVQDREVDSAKKEHKEKASKVYNAGGTTYEKK